MDARSEPILRPVDHRTWAAVADLEVTPAQRGFVAEPSRYLSLCCYGTSGWAPLAVLLEERVVGFLMWAVDPEDSSCWLGGILIDRGWQGQGLGKRAVRAAIEGLAESGGHRRFALSYTPANDRARAVYAALGFVETGELEGDEVVARLDLDARQQ